MSPERQLKTQQQALADGSLTSTSLTRRTLERIGATNGDWHIFISLDEAGSLAAAAASDRRRAEGRPLGPLDGIPVAIKDNIDIAGMATTDGTGFYKDIVRPEDAFVVSRLRAAGAVIVGKLNMHECALGATTDNPFWGRCANPAVAGATPGGSSGGSAAAIAGGLVSLTLGTDTMGSVRIPAAYCGVWGIKPTRGLVSGHGLSTLSWTLDTIGVLADSAHGLAAGLGAIAGFDTADPDSTAAPAGWDTASIGIDLSNLVLGRPSALARVDCEPEVLLAYEAVLARARRAGATIVDVDIVGWEPTLARRAGLLVCEAEVASRVGTDIDRPGSAFSEPFKSLVNFGRKAPGEKIAAAYRRLDLLRRATLDALQGLDALIMPTAPQRAFAHGSPPPANQADLTALANIAFCPAVAFPVRAADGRAPASCQLLGAPFSEGWLISIASGLYRLDDASVEGTDDEH